MYGFSLVLLQELHARFIVVPDKSQDTADHVHVLWFQVLLRVWGAVWWVIDPYRGEEKTGGVGDVCLTQVVGERVVNRPRERMGVQNGGVWGDDRES